MADELIQQALAQASDTAEMLVGRGVIDEVGAVFQRAFPGAGAVVVADDNTFAVAGKQVHAQLHAAGAEVVEPYVYPGQPTLYAKHENVEPLCASLRDKPVIPVVVGAGTLNDLVKRAAFELERPYMVVATAASMDGYTAFGASLAVKGHKQTLECPAPRAVVADLDVLLDAPAPMVASGYGDLLGKVTAGADWMVADALGIEPIDATVWSLVQGPLMASLEGAAALRAGDPGAMVALVEGLLMSGLAMQAHQSSRPASGSEHQFSHLWEMEGLGRDLPVPLSHGFKVGVGSIAVAALYERILEIDLQDLDIDARCATWPIRADMERTVRDAHPLLASMAVEQTLAKYLSREDLAERLERLRGQWPVLREQLRAQLVSPFELREMLVDAGCPTHPEEIGLSLEELKASYARAQMIRKRYTVLDLAVEAGVLDRCVEELFTAGGYWSG